MARWESGTLRTVAHLRAVAEEPVLKLNVELVRAGPPALRAAIVRPQLFEKGRRYPVIVYVYGGPGVRVVT